MWDKAMVHRVHCAPIFNYLQCRPSHLLKIKKIRDFKILTCVKFLTLLFVHILMLLVNYYFLHIQINYCRLNRFYIVSKKKDFALNYFNRLFSLHYH